MLDKVLVHPIASTLPTVIFTVALLAACLGIGRYLDAREQLDIRATDRLYLTRLDRTQQGQYQDYRDHRVYPDPAARWVGSEREMKELKQWIKQRDIVIQAALSHQGSDDMQSFKNWLH